MERSSILNKIKSIEDAIEALQYAYPHNIIYLSDKECTPNREVDRDKLIDNLCECYNLLKKLFPEEALVDSNTFE